MLKKILIAVAALIVLLLSAGLVLPKSAHAERSVVIDAPAERIYPQIASLKEWNEWSAWNTRHDPKWKPVYSGPDVGAGATSTWTESESGAGSQKGILAIGEPVACATTRPVIVPSGSMMMVPVENVEPGPSVTALVVVVPKPLLLMVMV